MNHRLGINIWGAVVFIAFTTQIVMLFDYFDFARAIQYDPIVIKEVIARKVSFYDVSYVHVRHLIFIFSRIIAILIGLGIILRSNFCRIAGILACLLMIILIGPRHAGFPTGLYDWYYWFRWRMIFNAIEIFLCSGFVYYFSRPAVVKFFKNK